MTRSLLKPFAAIALIAFPLSALGDDAFFVKDNDRVVFYGDSITDQRLYTTFTESFVVTRFPKRNVAFVHSGWGGDRVTGGGGGPIDRRLKRDVIAYKPTIVTVMLGMNDGSYRAFDQSIFDRYANGYTHLVDTLQGALPGLRMTLIAPSPFDDVTRPPTFEGGYNAVLVRYGEFVKDLAEKKSVGFADLNSSVVAATKKAFEADPQNAIKLNPDRVHPGPSGQLLMAAALLRAWKAPALVSSVTIDAGSGKTTQTENAQVSNLTCGSAIAWTQEDGALPMPINFADPLIALAVRSSDLVESLDRQVLVIKGAPSAEYQLKIDGEVVGTFSRAQLAEGINLATLPTPMLEQARHVHDLTLKHNNIHFIRWRNIQVPLQDEDESRLARALEALDALEADVVQEQRAAAQPRPHEFELVPTS